MWAVSVDVEISDPEAARTILPGVVEMVRQVPGFVSGYWVQLDDGNGTSVVIVDTEENARANPPVEGESPGDGVTFSRVRIGEVVAQA
jgi:hypothetical protein